MNEAGWIVEEGFGMTDDLVREAPDEGSNDTFRLLNKGGEPVLLTHLPEQAWRQVYAYFDGRIPKTLYVAVLRLRVIASRLEMGLKEPLRWRDPLVNMDFFNAVVYEAESLQARLAAAIRWAISRHYSRDADLAIQTVAVCLSSPMGGRAYA